MQSKSSTTYPGKSGGCGKPQTKRAFHHKRKTGCRTCRIRRVRCDEQKPACNRCTSTGRKCDGYATDPLYLTSFTPSRSSSSTRTLSNRHPSTLAPSFSNTNKESAIALRGHSISALNTTADRNLYFIRSDPDQVRSFRYFLEISAPSIASSSNAIFWTEEIPRACHDDPAIWHAVVSLGAIYEDHVALSMAGKTCQSHRNAFALQQFNQSVRKLLSPGPQDVQNKWRAVVMSVVFTTACLVEGLYDQARLHFTSGCTLLNEIEASDIQPESRAYPISLSDYSRNRNLTSSVTPTAVSMAAVRDALLGLELWAHGIGDNTASPSLLSPLNRTSNLWKEYSAPCRRDANDKLLTAQNLIAANKAVESLFIAQTQFTWEHTKALETVQIEPTAERLEKLCILQQPFVQSFKELHKAMVGFQEELGKAHRKNVVGTSNTAQLGFGLRFLSLYVAASRIFIIPTLKNFSLAENMKDPRLACSRVVEVAEAIIAEETKLKLTYPSPVFGPLPSVTIPISIITVVAPTANIRVRALNILKHPRVEGFLDGRQTASLAQAIMVAETASDNEHRSQVASEKMESDAPAKNHILCQGQDVHPLSRCFSTIFTPTQRGEGLVHVRTWRDYMNGSKGKASKINW